ncbi:hypothetical protein OIDMADRAFT_56904 [Oidiodendron maius Zn]|uniref:NACHT-NTPase and P-loop NTPases N-terminal domain-containing protein n=1 Tax=Oidiodendron maius (strain Zn) TaxID=913774 RepID=A0A0C3H815_OIDMZ|nr:hypothetical protein OIDMADRAFT_56904 [Oidiodendron maius Zn]
MSGAEFIAAAGVISSTIAIVDGIKQVVNAVSEADGLPKAFREADIDTTTAAEKEELAKIIRYTFVSSDPKPARLRDIPEREKFERETPERKKGNLVKSTLHSIIEEKFGRYTDNKGRDTFRNAAKLRKDGENGSGYAYRLGSYNFDPHKVLAEAIRRGEANMVWTILYCLPQVRKEWSSKCYSNQATANLDSKYRRFPNKINMDYREESHSLLELAFRRIKLCKGMENAILILMRLIAHGADIN